MRRTFVVLLALAVLPWRIYAQEPDFPKILAQIDDMASFHNADFTATITAVSEKPGEDASVLQARMFRRDRERKFSIIILKPDAQKGRDISRRTTTSGSTTRRAGSSPILH